MAALPPLTASDHLDSQFSPVTLRLVAEKQFPILYRTFRNRRVLIEALLSKIAFAVFKKAAILGPLKWLAGAYEIYSVIDSVLDLADCIETANDCNELSVCGLKVVSDPLSSAVIDRLIHIGSHSFEVERTDSGLYLASSLTPRFALNPSHFPAIQTMRFPRFDERRFPNL